jgi:hypothetical protein
MMIIIMTKMMWRIEGDVRVVEDVRHSTTKTEADEAAMTM